MSLSLILFAIHFVTLDPGHFHAALVQKSSYPEVADEVRVFAPEGAELTSHLKLIDSFNQRQENPTAWREKLYVGEDYLPAFVAAARSGALGENPIVILAGKNNLKGDYALAAVKNDVHVLSDKPMAITPEDYAKLEKAAKLAVRKGLLFDDIMTSRYDMPSILQKALSRDRDLYGEQEKGSLEEPAITKESVHHFCKLVNGAPLKRPEWYYDTRIQGEGIVDVTTHLVDLIQWTAFGGQTLSKRDVEMLDAKTYPTMISPAEFKLSTGGTIEQPLACESNGFFTWKLKGVVCKVSVRWDFMAPKGSGDTHTSVMRGTKAEVMIRQGKEENFKPVVYVRARGDAKATEVALKDALRKLNEGLPGVAAEPTAETGLWRITYPSAYDIGHEAEFAQVVRSSIATVKSGVPRSVDNLLVKYYTLVEAWKMAHAAK